MKRFLLLFLLVSGAWLRPLHVRAQAAGTDSLNQKLTRIFAPLDKSQVPTGYLYEAGVRFLEPRYYNGVLSDSNRTSMDARRYLRAQLASCRVYGGFGRLQIERPGNGAARLRLRLSTLPDGLYTVHVLRGQTVVSRLRLQVQK